MISVNDFRPLYNVTGSPVPSTEYYGVLNLPLHLFIIIIVIIIFSTIINIALFFTFIITSIFEKKTALMS